MNDTSYNKGLLEIQQLNSKLEGVSFDYEREMVLAAENCPSNLDQYDFIFSITIGILGAILDTNDKIAEFLDEVHQLASLDTVESDNKFKPANKKSIGNQAKQATEKKQRKKATAEASAKSEQAECYRERPVESVSTGISSVPIYAFTLP